MLTIIRSLKSPHYRVEYFNSLRIGFLSHVFLDQVLSVRYLVVKVRDFSFLIVWPIRWPLYNVIYGTTIPFTQLWITRLLLMKLCKEQSPAYPSHIITTIR